MTTKNFFLATVFFFFSSSLSAQGNAIRVDLGIGPTVNWAKTLDNDQVESSGILAGLNFGADGFYFLNDSNIAIGTGIHLEFGRGGVLQFQTSGLEKKKLKMRNVSIPIQALIQTKVVKATTLSVLVQPLGFKFRLNAQQNKTFIDGVLEHDFVDVKKYTKGIALSYALGFRAQRGQLGANVKIGGTYNKIANLLKGRYIDIGVTWSFNP